MKEESTPYNGVDPLKQIPGLSTQFSFTRLQPTEPSLLVRVNKIVLFIRAIATSGHGFRQHHHYASAKLGKFFHSAKLFARNLADSPCFSFPRRLSASRLHYVGKDTATIRQNETWRAFFFTTIKLDGMQTWLKGLC